MRHFLPLLLACLFAAAALAQKTVVTEQDYEREEAGVNPYTAPTIARIFEQLDALRPLPFDAVRRELAAPGHGSREQTGLAFGGLVADGFLIVECEKRNLVDDLGRALLREARGLGVADRVLRHSKSLTELGRRGDWPAIRRELTDTQADVEAAMVELHDEKLAHLISLGGWLRGLEISAGAVTAEFTPARAKVLWQPDLINYFVAELKTLRPDLRRAPLFEKLRAGMAAIQTGLNSSLPNGLTPDEVKALRDRAHELNSAIQSAAPADQPAAH